MAYLVTCDGYNQDLFPRYGFGFFAAGNSVRFYRYSLYWLVHHAGLDNVAAEVPKDGEPLLYGQLSMDDLGRLEANGLIVGLKRHFWGVSWSYKCQRSGGPAGDFANYDKWRNNIFKGTKGFLYGPLAGAGKPDCVTWSA